MKWASSCQVSFSDLQEAVDDSVAVCKAELGGKPEVDLALMFISSRFTESRGGATPIDQSDLDRAMETVKRELGAKHILGCLGGGRSSQLPKLAFLVSSSSCRCSSSA